MNAIYFIQTHTHTYTHLHAHTWLNIHIQYNLSLDLFPNILPIYSILLEKLEGKGIYIL